MLGGGKTLSKPMNLHSFMGQPHGMSWKLLVKQQGALAGRSDSMEVIVPAW